MAQTMPRSQDTLKKDETVSLIASDKVRGTKIYNRRHEHVGEVEDIMIDKLSGVVAYAVVGFGGFLGLGETRRAVPWSVLHYDTTDDGFVADVDDAVLKNAPNEIPAGDAYYRDVDWNSRIYSHFGVPPYWI
ncbi:MAG TPA: PRC-barrel domain-containing protein [Candidatus Binatia bacterium]|nr:PRC-barrel domain-containing protein [Candidatus Binatia bacterium]